MIRILTLSLLCIMLGCSNYADRIENAEVLAEAAAHLPTLFNIPENDSVSILAINNPSDMKAQIKFKQIYPPPDADVTEKIPKSIGILKPTRILIHKNVATIQLEGGGPAGHAGICIFFGISDETVSQAVDELDLKLINKKHHIYQYNLYDYRMISQRVNRITKHL